MNWSPETQCPICGGCEFIDHNVLWPELISAWELTPEETAYINRQQGSVCRQCGGNIRSAALAKAICRKFDFSGTLDQFLLSPPVYRILEVNEAGTLTERLKKFPGHRIVSYPECDLMSMSFEDESFDLVVHSDTLEHVRDPSVALGEIHRVLVNGGATIFTVPILVGRQTRSRNGLPPSFHGESGTNSPDLLVHTEFGSDIWCIVLSAGFSECCLISYQYPAGIAVLAVKSNG